VIVADVAVLFIALPDLGVAKATLALAAGWLLLLAGFLALYLVSAIAINGTFGKTVLSLPTPYVK